MNNNNFFRTVDCSLEDRCSHKNTSFCNSCVRNKMIKIKDYFCELKSVLNYNNK